MNISGLTLTDSQTRLSELIAHILMLDLETTRSGRIRHIGAVLNGFEYEEKKRAGTSTALKRLESCGYPIRTTFDATFE